MESHANKYDVNQLQPHYLSVATVAFFLFRYMGKAFGSVDAVGLVRMRLDISPCLLERVLRPFTGVYVMIRSALLPFSCKFQK